MLSGRRDAMSIVLTASWKAGGKPAWLAGHHIFHRTPYLPNGARNRTRPLSSCLSSVGGGVSSPEAANELAVHTPGGPPEAAAAKRVAREVCHARQQLDHLVLVGRVPPLVVVHQPLIARQRRVDIHSARGAGREAYGLTELQLGVVVTPGGVLPLVDL